MAQSPSEYVRQLLERLRPDRRMSLAIGIGAAACFGLSYYDALYEMELRDTTLPPNAVRHTSTLDPHWFCTCSARIVHRPHSAIALAPPPL